MKKSAMALVTFLLIGLTGLASSWAVTVTIRNPSNNAQFLAGELIFLQGEGTETVTQTDPDTGDQTQEVVPLFGNQLSWYANGTLIGSGEVLSWRPAAGNYRISLIGRATTGSALDEIEIIVLSEADLTVTVSIDSPASGSTYESGTAILFFGKGGVEETGENLSGNQLVWYSDRDGIIGTGTSFSRADLSPGAHLITLVGDGRAIATITITITSISIYLPEPITSGEFAVYDWGKNILYIPLLIEDTPYFVNLAVTDWTSDPVQMSLRYIGLATFNATYRYASFDFLSNTLLVPDYRIGDVSYKLILTLTTNEDPFVFDLVGSILNP
jgi:hypothetical protein